MNTARPRPSRWPLVGLVFGLALVIVPFVWTVVSVSRASDVQGGLREATKIPGRQDDVGSALGSASLSALLIPAGVLLTVLSALAVADRRRQPPADGALPPDGAGAAAVRPAAARPAEAEGKASAARPATGEPPEP